MLAPVACAPTGASGAPNRRELWASEEPPPEGEGSSSPGLLVTPHDETATHQRLPDQAAAKDGVHFVTAGRDAAEQPLGPVVLGVPWLLDRFVYLSRATFRIDGLLVVRMPTAARRTT